MGVAALDTGNLLYDPKFEHDACGVGFVADIGGHRSGAILEKALACVRNVTHRGAVSADAKTGDGAGILTQVPYRLLRRHIEATGQRLPRGEDLAVGMIFFPGANAPVKEKLRRTIEDGLGRHGFHLFGWRRVPVDESALGEMAAASAPAIEQVLIGRGEGSDIDFGRRLYLARREIEREAALAEVDDFYIPSFSHKTVAYKGLFVAPQLPVFFKDLQDPDFETALALFHQRYSTNTFPSWFLAQPFRFLAHNGEINTLQGNVNWLRAREPELRSKVWGQEISKLIPIIQEAGSDSAKLDNAAEALTMSGRGLLHTMMMLVPEAWESMPHMTPLRKQFYEYHACLTEPWDGPAALTFSDGDVVAACLDRNGLRPARYKHTDDGIVVMGSEVGIVEMDDARIVSKGRLGPGEMIAVDTKRREFLLNDQIKNEVAGRKPYGKWVERQRYRLGPVPSPNGADGYHHEMEIVQAQRAFGFTLEDIVFVLRAMILEGKEPIFSMGDDTPISALAKKPRLLYSYFKQRFAQVTNPPIDPLREELVMSLNTYLGARGSLLEESAQHANLVHFESPVLDNEQLHAIRHLRKEAFKATTLEALFDPGAGPEALGRAVERLCQQALDAVDAGSAILILSDRGVEPDRAPVPMLLAVGAVHHHLIREGRRMRASIVVETGEPREVHHFACLIGYGASAVNPYLQYASVRHLVDSGEIQDMELKEAEKSFRKAIDNGILKIMSKMGISTVTSYHGGQIFEAIGLRQDLIESCFTGTTSWVAGIGMRELGEDVIAKHRHAFEPSDSRKLEDHGYYRFRRDGEYHGNNPQMVRALHAAVASGSYDDYKVFSDMITSREPMAIRDLLEFRGGTPVPLEEVQPVEEILVRFSTASMSLGALSPEAHVTLAKAMNRLGARSNTGEGGDDPVRYWPSKNGDSPHSRIKQVASGRFGVTTPYLASADELEIKMAQGSKPGEGGQLPGHKVVEHIAKLRHTVPGIQLISPPPHHDIYSIEDLAQLIYDLKQVNPRCKVVVKLVSEAGVGTIAAGVAKGYADIIMVSGDSGGTGASPLSSIKNAGSPWELGLSETHQVLVLNDLRGRVILRTDGGMKTGRDVVVAAMLGADGYAFGTAALIAIGCKMARQCHLNTCPVGVATQKEELRNKFFGTPDMAIHYFTHVAQEIREILASLGFRSLDEIIGRADLLQQAETADPRARLLDLSRILANPDPSGTKPRKCVTPRNDRPGDVPLDDQLLADGADALTGANPVQLEYQVKNVNRTVGTKFAGEMAHRYHTDLPTDLRAKIKFTGSAGQSFGAFSCTGIRLVLEGEANDYVGKGLSGGEIIVRPPAAATFPPHDNIIIGNTVLYGATAGSLFASGRAGERFAVRNSGATAVVEGVGDHCCEYMTAGLVVVLGDTGRNFGAGMTNGRAYVLDEGDHLPDRYNPEMIYLDRVTSAQDEQVLRSLIEQHLEKTFSPKAREVLEGWDHYLPKFWRVASRTDRELISEAPVAEAAGAVASP